MTHFKILSQKKTLYMKLIII